MLTTFDLDEYVFAALRAGASGFLLKDVTPEHLVAAVHLVAFRRLSARPGHHPSPRRAFRTALPRGNDIRGSPSTCQYLTPRELDVLQLLARGLSNAELAAQLYLSEATVKMDVTLILSKLTLRDRAQAIVARYESAPCQTGGRPSTRRLRRHRPPWSIRRRRRQLLAPAPKRVATGPACMARSSPVR